MSTRAEVRNGFDALTASTLSASPAVAVLYGNQYDARLSEGSAPYIKQRVFFSSDDQASLGDQGFRRHKGYVLFLIFVRKGSGDLARDDILDRLSAAFASKFVGPATTLDPQMVVSSQSENWDVTGMQIPFYFDNYEE